MGAVRQILVQPTITLAVDGSDGEDRVTQYQEIGQHDFKNQLPIILENFGASTDIDMDYALGYKTPDSTPYHEAVVPMSGIGLDDMTHGASSRFNGKGQRRFRIQIDAEGATDTYKWTRDVEGGTWDAEGVSCSTTEAELAEGVTVVFGAITGHTTDDWWDLWVSDVYFDAWVSHFTAKNIATVGTYLPGIDVSSIDLKPIQYIRFRIKNDGSGTAIVRLIMLIKP